MKKLLASILAIAMALSSMGIVAFAEKTASGVAKIGETEYATFAEAITAASAMTDDVTVEIYDKVTLNQSLSGSYSSITFKGIDTDAEIYLDVQGYITATGKKVAFDSLTLSKSAGGFITNAGFMNVAFGVYDVNSVAYTNCTFTNGAYASSGNVTFTNCTFYRSHDKYGLWAYGNVDVTVDGCTFADYRGIKMYAEGAAKTVDLTVKNTDFFAVTDKPAIVLTYGESVTLEGNTYSSTGVFELDLDGAPNGTTVTSTDAITCKNDNGSCGVLVDGKIYTTVAQAAAVATSGSTVTLLHNSTETVELAEGVTLNKNGYTAEKVTVATPAPVIVNAYVAQDTHVNGWTTVWGQLAITGTESFYIEIYSGETYLGKTTLVDTNEVLLDGTSHEVTWHAFLDGSDSWWNTEWTVEPVSNLAPTDVKYYVDGEQIGSGVVKMSSADDLNPVVWAELRGVKTAPVAKIGDVEYTDLQEAITEVKDGETINILTNIDITTAAYGQNALNHARAISFTLDLGGNTISADTGNSVFRFNIANSDATSDVTVTLQNGKIVSGSNTWCAVMSCGKSADIKAIFNLENLTIENSKGYDFGVKAWEYSLVNAKNVTINATNQAGGFYAVGGEMVLDNCTVNQCGLYTAPYTSMAFAAATNNGSRGKITINSGNYTTTPTSAEEGNGQGSTHGSWCGGVMNSGGDIVINGGTFTNGNYGDDSLATAARGLIVADTGAYVEINGGTFNALKGVFDICNNLGDASKNPTGIITGGTFSADPTNDYVELADGYELVANEDGTYGVAEEKTGLSGSGTEEDPYLINNIDDLKIFRDMVDEQLADGSSQFAGKYFKLTADINLDEDGDGVGENWNPIGSMSGDHGSFKGVFDGDGHIISNLNVQTTGNGLGLFARTSGNAVIKNLTFNNVTVKSTDNSNYVGGVVGNSYASTKIENVHVKGTIDISGRGYIGGISGHGYVVMDNVSVIGEGTISSTFWCAGGILGYGAEGTTHISNAKVEGTGTGLLITSAAGGLGAIVGMAEDNEGTQPISGENLSAKNVDIKTYIGAYGDAYANYALGYLYGGNPTSELAGTLTVEDVVIETSSGVAPEVNDAVAAIEDSIYFDLNSAFAAAQDSDTITLLRDITLDSPVTIKKLITLDGDGHSIKQSATCNNNIALVYFEGSANNVLDVTIKNTTFDGLKAGAAIRTLYANMNIDNCVFENCEHTVGQGLVRLTYGTANITNSKFLNNDCSMGISFNWDADATISANDTLTIDNCEFTGNTANKTALIYHVKGASCEIKNSEFKNNTVNCNENGATIYLGFQENCSVTGNVFENNTVTEATGSTRVAGAIFFGYETEISGNVFVNNTASNANGDALGQICTSTYYECDINLDGNYWGGKAPVYGVDYTVQHQTGDATFTLDKYNASYYVDEDGNIVLSGETEIPYVATVGKFSYTTIQAAIDAATSGDTVTLIADVSLTETLVIAEDDVITLDLNGKTISQTNEQTAGYQMILNDGKLTINDSVGGGKISYTDSGNGGEYISDTIYNRGTLVINGGTIENLSSATVASNGYPHAVDTYSGIRDTSVTINNGTIYCAEYSAIRMFCVSATCKADLIINGGTIKGAVDMQNGIKNAALGSLTINGGTFETTKNANNIRFANWNGGATEYGITAAIKDGSFNGGITTDYVPAVANWNSKIVSGGTFSDNSVAKYVADGYAMSANTDGTYGVIEYTTTLFERLVLVYNMNPITENDTLYYPVHVYAGIDTLQYKEVGFKITAVNNANPDGLFQQHSTNEVYTAMNVTDHNGNVTTYQASDLGGNYMFAHALKFKASNWKNEDTILYITPYAKKLDGTVIDGITKKISDALVKEKDGSALFKEEK